MENSKKETIINNITAEIEKIKKNDFSFLFFVIDTKGTPNGHVEYVYETALALKELGYNVKMIHGESEFVGVESWLGEKYATLPHFNIETDGVTISPSDFLIIPEIYANVMHKTFEKHLPCKRIALLSNFNYLTEIIQPGATWLDYNIRECITTTKEHSNHLKELFPEVETQVVRPYINELYYNDDTAKKLIINIIADKKTDVNKIVKEFFWKYPMYKWVGFRDVRGIAREEFSEALREAFATVWVDDDTNFGASALEAMACGNIVIGKIPQDVPEWMSENDNLENNGVWFYNMHDVHEIIANVVQSFIHNNVPDVLYKNADDSVSKYRKEQFVNDIKTVYIEHFVAQRIKDLEEYLSVTKNNFNEENV